MLLAGSERRLRVLTLTIVDSGAVDKERLREWGSLRLRREDLKHRFMEPVSQWKSAQINIPVGRRRSVDDDWSNCAIAVLHRVVAVIPRSAVLSCLECVGLRLARGNWALGDAIRTVHLVAV